VTASVDATVCNVAAGVENNGAEEVASVVDVGAQLDRKVNPPPAGAAAVVDDETVV